MADLLRDGSETIFRDPSKIQLERFAEKRVEWLSGAPVHTEGHQYRPHLAGIRT
jgi:hypothetical protein